MYCTFCCISRELAAFLEVDGREGDSGGGGGRLHLGVMQYNVAHVSAACGLGIRHDGRGPSDGRDVEVKLIRGEDVAVAEVSFGGTSAVAKVTLKLEEPEAYRPSEGRITLSVDVSPLAHERGGVSGGKTEARFRDELTRFLERCYRDSGALDKEGLCVASGVSAWSVRCDCHVVVDRGNASNCVALRAAKGCESLNFEGSYLGQIPLVSAHFWTSDHLSSSSRTVNAFSDRIDR